jgi:hypothetical protein
MLHSKTPNNTKARSLNWVDYISPSSKSKDVCHVNNIPFIQYCVISFIIIVKALRDVLNQAEIDLGNAEIDLNKAEKELETKGDELTQSECERDAKPFLSFFLKILGYEANSLQESPQQDFQADEKCKQKKDELANCEKNHANKLSIYNERLVLSHKAKFQYTQRLQPQYKTVAARAA